MTYSIQNKGIRKELPISEYQKRFFLEWALSPSDTTYNVSLVNKITGNLKEQILKDACRVLIEQNEVLHAQYSVDGEHCFYGNFSISDFYHTSSIDASKPIDEIIRQILDKTFDLTSDVLFRLHLVKDQVNNEYYFILLAHHIVADAIAASQICAQIQDAYYLLSGNNNVTLNIDQTFTNAVLSEQGILHSDYKKNAQKYWLNFINNIPLNISLPYRSDVAAANFDKLLADKTGEFIYFELSASETALLKVYAKQKRTTVFIALSALYGVVLSKYSNQQKLLLSYAINMRPKGFNDTVGCFVNNIPLKFELSDVNTLSDLIQLLGLQRKEVREHQGYSLTEIMQDQRDANHGELDVFFNVGFTQANLNSASLSLNGVDCTALNVFSSNNIVNEMGLLYDEYSSDVIKFKFEFRKALF